jgi:hypothetical protein
VSAWAGGAQFDPGSEEGERKPSEGRMPIRGFPDSFNAGNPHNLIYGRLGENLNAMD